VTGSRSNGEAKVFVVEPHPITRVGICRLIDQAPGLSVAGQAGRLEEALTGIAEGAVSLVVVEPLMAPNEEDGLIAALSRAAPGARILALSARLERGYVRRILETGVSGFVAKHESATRVIRAIRQVLGGKTTVAGVPEPGS